MLLVFIYGCYWITFFVNRNMKSRISQTFVCVIEINNGIQLNVYRKLQYLRPVIWFQAHQLRATLVHLLKFKLRRVQPFQEYHIFCVKAPANFTNTCICLLFDKRAQMFPINSKTVRMVALNRRLMLYWSCYRHKVVF